MSWQTREDFQSQVSHTRCFPNSFDFLASWDPSRENTASLMLHPRPTRVSLGVLGPCVWLNLTWGIKLHKLLVNAPRTQKAVAALPAHRARCPPVPERLPGPEQVEMGCEHLGALGRAIWKYPFTVGSTTIPNLCSYSDKPIGTGYLIGKLNNHL